MADNQHYRNLRQNTFIADDVVDGGVDVSSTEIERRASRVSQSLSFESNHSRNPLIKLLTKSRSSTLGCEKERSLAGNLQLLDHDSDTSQKSRSRFNPKKIKLKVGNSKEKNQDVSSTEDRTQHNSSHLKSVDPSNKLTSSGPSIVQFFNRPHGANAERETFKREQFAKKQFGRTSVTLSSQSSNSLIQDVNLASRFRFNTSDNLGASSSNNTHLNSSSLHGIHRKYLISADQYILEKWNKNIGDEVHATIKSPKNDTYLNLAEAFDFLLEHLKRLFVPTVNPKGTESGTSELTVEHLSRFVYHQIVKPIFIHQRLMRASNAVDGDSTLGTILEDPPDETKEARQSEVLQELMHSTKSWLSVLRRTWLESMKRDQNIEDPRWSIVYLWKALAELWNYFNRTIRFALMQVFTPIQSCIDSDFLRLSGCNSPIHVIESVILLAYKDAVVIPILAMRKAAYASTSRSPKKPSHEKLNSTEMQYVLEKPLVHKRLISCFGIIISFLNAYSGLLKDDSTVRDPVLHDAIRCLQDIAL